MLERFTPLNDEALVFRLATPAFVPEGARLPLATWLRPTDADVAEGAARGRPAGLSSWDAERTTVAQAKAFLSSAVNAIAYSMRCGAVRRVGVQFKRNLDVVADPRDDDQRPGWEGHCLIEGLERPKGSTKKDQLDLSVGLLDACARLEDA